MNLSVPILLCIILYRYFKQFIQKLQSLQNQMEFEGHIQLIYGPMFSGKSSELLRKIRRYHHAKKTCLVVNYLHDNRYSAESVMSTHDQQTQKALKVSKLLPLIQQASKYNVVGIDQGQFFQDIVQFAETLANMGVIIIIAALDSTFQRKPFGNIINLVPLAEKVIKLSAVCVYCTQAAAFTQRTVVSQQIELIGGEQSYKPVCRQCFYNQPRKSRYQKSQVSSSEQVQKQVQKMQQNEIELQRQEVATI